MSGTSSKILQMVLREEAQHRVPVLLVVSNPLESNFAFLDWQEEVRELERSGLPIALIRLNPPTWSELQNTLLTRKISILHFIGHGNEDGLWLEKENGQANFIHSNDLAEIIRGCGVHLVILNTCNSWGPGQALANANLNAVVASKRQIFDAIGPSISKTLYNALISGEQSVFDAVKTAQKVATLSIGSSGRDLLVALGIGANQPLPLPVDAVRSTLGAWVPVVEPVHNLELGRMDNFVGRTHELTQDIFPLLKDSKHRAIALMGLGGIGKTTLVTAIGWRYGWMFSGGIVFTTANDNPSFGLEDIIRTLSQVLKWETGTDSFREREQIILNNLAQSQILLILDNLDTVTPKNREEIARFLNRWDTRLGGKTILAMREYLPEFEPIVKDAFIKVDSLDLNSANKLLEGLIKDSKTDSNLTDSSNNIVETLYRVPLLIQLTAGLINRGGTWGELKYSVSTGEGSFSEYYHETLGQMTKRLVSQHPTIPYLLNSWSVFRGGADRKAWEALVQPYLQLLPITESNVSDGLRILRDSQMFSRDASGRHQAHPIVSQYLRVYIWDNLPEVERVQIFQNYLRFFLQYISQAVEVNKGFRPLQIEFLNLQNALLIAQELEEWDAIKFIAKNLYKFLDVSGRWSEWENLIQIGLVAAEKTDDKQSKSTFIYYEAELCKRRSQFELALYHLIEAEALARSVNDKNLLGRIIAQRGMILLPQGQPERARAEFFKSISDLTDVGDIGRLAKIYRAISQAAKQLGNVDEMHEYALKSYNLELIELEGQRDWGIAASRMLLGDWAKEVGDLETAQHLFEQALPVLSNSVDASRQLYAELLYAMGGLEAKKNNIADAKNLFSRSLEIAKGLGYLYLISLLEKDLAKIEN